KPQISDYRGYLFRDFASGVAAIREAMQNDVPAAMLRLSDAEETRFYRAFGALGTQRGLKEHLQDSFLGLQGFDGKACALIAGFEGSAVEVARGRKTFAAIAGHFRALPIGRGPGARWHEGRFHGPYLRDPMMDRGVGVDTLETATTWSKVNALYAAV